MSQEQTKPQNDAKIVPEVLRDLALKSSKVHLNVEENYIYTTEDKLRLCLVTHLQRVERKRGWTTPLGVFLTTGITLSTATFRDIGLSASVWQSIFVILAVASFCWLALSAWQAVKAEKIDDIVNDIKKSSTGFEPR